MGSSRLPEKVLKKINKKTLLHYQIERVKQALSVDRYIIATTNQPNDRAIVNFCQQYHVDVFCGDENNVLSRFYHAAKAFNVDENDLIIRLTSDCPLVAPELIDQLVHQHLSNKNIAVSNIDINSYPRGFDVEVFSMSALTEAFINASTTFQQEHVTPYFYQNQQQYPCQSIRAQQSCQSSNLRLCVDEPADFELIEQLTTHFPNNIIKASAKEIIDFLMVNPQIATINQNVQQKSC